MGDFASVTACRRPPAKLILVNSNLTLSVSERSGWLFWRWKILTWRKTDGGVSSVAKLPPSLGVMVRAEPFV